jgi:hypothetical protein
MEYVYAYIKPLKSQLHELTSQQGHSKVQALTLMKWLKQHGPETTAELAAFIYRQKYALKRVVEEEGLDCEFEMRRSFDVFLDGEQAGEVKSWFEKCLREDHEWTRECCWVGEKEAEQVSFGGMMC